MRIFAILLLAGFIARAQTFSTIGGLDASDAGPNWLIQGNDGNFYGTSKQGTVFRMTPSGSVTTIYTVPSGDGPVNSLLQGSDGNFYGTVYGFLGSGVGITGASAGPGSIFKLTPDGKQTTLHAFGQSSSVDGAHPTGGLVQGADGNFYGTTSLGGVKVGFSADGEGTVFSITPSGTLTILHNFSITDGSGPNGLILASDGDFYGTTFLGGSGPCQNPLFGNGCGTVFKITPSGTLTTVYNFTNMSDGGRPETGLIQGADGNFYGATVSGGQNNNGTIFSITPSGALTTLYNFPNPSSSNTTETLLVQAPNGNFYGIAGGVGDGAVFEMTKDGTVSILHTFQGADGANPSALIVGGGNLYGTTAGGSGTNANGSVFKLSLGSTGEPAPVITSVNNGASSQPGISPGSWFTIYGTNFATQAASWTIVDGVLPTTVADVNVSVGGQAAYVEYVSATQINALVPNVPAGTVPVIVTNSGGASQAVDAQLSAETPAFFQWGTYAVATHQDYTFSVKNGTFAGLTTVPAAPGDVIILWGSGFGPTSPAAPSGMETPSSTTYNTANKVSVTVGGKTATVYGAALASGFAGLYQIAIQVPAGLANGDYPLVATVNGASSPSTTLITVQQ